MTVLFLHACTCIRTCYEYMCCSRAAGHSFHACFCFCFCRVAKRGAPDPTLDAPPVQLLEMSWNVASSLDSDVNQQQLSRARSSM